MEKLSFSRLKKFRLKMKLTPYRDQSGAMQDKALCWFVWSAVGVKTSSGNSGVVECAIPPPLSFYRPPEVFRANRILTGNIGLYE